MKVIVDKGAYLPVEHMSTLDIHTVRQELTITPRSFGNEEVKSIPTFALVNNGAYLRVPVAYGEAFADERGWEVDYRLPAPPRFVFPKKPDPHHPLAPAGQAELFSGTVRGLKESTTLLVESPTGSGKTVNALNAAATLETKLLVLVDSKTLMRQWVAEAVLHLGMKEEEVGVIHGTTMKWEGKGVVVAVIHNLCQKTFPKEFYKNFGMVVWDEAQILGARFFAKSIYLMRAYYRLAMSATPYRKDGADAILFNQFGQVGYKGKVKALPCSCRIVEYNDTPSKHVVAFNKGDFPRAIMLKMLTKDFKRNQLIADLVVGCIDSGRRTLVISDSIEHLHTVQSMVTQTMERRGIKWRKEELGMFTGHYLVDGSKKKTAEAYLDHIKKDPKHKVVFATYSMMEKGVDIKYLDAGIDATPRSSGTQVIGRIRRPFPNKKKAVWFTIVDTKVFRLVRAAKARVKDYTQSGVVVN